MKIKSDHFPSLRQPGVILSFAGLFLALLVFVYFLILLFWPIKITTIHAQPIPVLKKILLQGEIVPLRWEYTKHIDQHGLVYVKFINELSYTVPSPYPAAARKGKYSLTSYSIGVPSHLPPGLYHLESRFVFEVNVLRTISFTVESEQFEVKKL